MIFSEESVGKLRNLVKQRLSHKRFTHTLGVEKLAEFIGQAIMPERTSELKVAALLHDVAKEISDEMQLALIKKSNLKCTDEDRQTLPALHSFSACALIQDEFPEYATKDVLSAVFNHTLGAPGMSVFDEIIYISDYAEEGRKFPTCIEIGDYLKSNITHSNTYNANLLALHSASHRRIARHL